MLCKESGGFDGPLALRAARPTARREPHGTSKYRVVSAQEGARGARDLQPLRRLVGQSAPHRKRQELRRSLHWLRASAATVSGGSASPIEMGRYSWELRH